MMTSGIGFKDQSAEAVDSRDIKINHGIRLRECAIKQLTLNKNTKYTSRTSRLVYL